MPARRAPWISRDGYISLPGCSSSATHNFCACSAGRCCRWGRGNRGLFVFLCLGSITRLQGAETAARSSEIANGRCFCEQTPAEVSHCLSPISDAGRFFSRNTRVHEKRSCFLVLVWMIAIKSDPWRKRKIGRTDFRTLSSPAPLLLPSSERMRASVHTYKASLDGAS